MAEVVLRLRQGPITRDARFDRRDLVLGAAPSCDLVLPMPGIAERHLRIVADAGITRVRLLTDASASVAGRPLNGDWHVVAPGEVVAIGIANESPVHLTVDTRSSVPGGTLVEDAPADAVHVPTTPQMATLEGITRTAPLFGVRPKTPVAAAKAERRPWTPERAGLLLGGLCVAVVAAGTLAAVFKQSQTAHAAGVVAAGVQSADEKITLAIKQMTAGQYAAAKQSLDDARVAAEAVGRGDAFAPRIAGLAEKPEIRLGANGYVQLDGRWQPADLAAREQAARDRDAPELARLKSAAQSALASNDNENARRYAEDALDLLGRRPVQPAAGTEAFKSIRDDAQNRIVAADMQRRGMVLAGGKWMTRDEKFRLDQTAAGLAEYRGRWMPKDEAFAAEQKDKGLTLVDGKWLSADQVKEAQGYVYFEDRWVLKTERDATLADRAEKARVAEAARQAERDRLNRQLNGQADPDVDRVDRAKAEAYLASQNAVKQRLREPDKAEFKPYGDPDVMVAERTGAYFIRARVNAPDENGVMVQKIYVCRVRKVADRWAVESVRILPVPTLP